MPIVTDPQRRAQIIETRIRLLNELNQILAAEEEDRRRQGRINRLQLKYGREEVQRLLLYMAELLDTDTDDLDAFHYQRYHETYRHFGGSRPALDLNQWQALNREWGGLHIRVVSAAQFGEPVGSGLLSPKEQERYDQLKETLLSDSFLWDDITPEDPGQNNLPSLRLMMRQFRRRKAAQAGAVELSTQITAPMHVAQAPMCPAHDLPILRLGGKDQCVQEYLDGCLIGKKISGVVAQGNTAYYVFEDGHRLPLLCSCCGSSLIPGSIVANRQRMVGQHLLTLAVEHNHDRNGQGYDELLLNFGGALGSSPMSAAVAFTAVARMEHPSGCRHA